MKGITNNHLSFARICLCILCAACISFSASAQNKSVKVNVKDVTVKELLKAIEAGSTYKFAYVDTDIDLSGKVTVNAENEDIVSILKKVLPDVNVTFRDQTIILNKKAPSQAPAQKVVKQGPRVVTGKVVDKEGQPVIGAMIIERGTQNGAGTDINGNYELKLKGESPVLEVSLIGYNTVTAALTANQTKADFVLEEEAIRLDDVVVIGYGVQNKRDVTTAVSSIKAEDFANTPTTDFRESMAAKMPGVQVLNLGGQPDGNVTVRVRGIQSATSGNDPLYVIDGIPCDSRAFANLDGNDIESLEVLKDASAAAIYGSRGSCGVIIVTTKRGGGEKPVISYDGQFSLSNVSKKIDMLDAYEFATMFRESRNGSYLFSEPTGSISDPSAGRPEVYHRIDPLINAYLEDKTGTLTEGKFSVTAVCASGNHDEKELLSMAAAAEKYSDHPVATALKTAAEPVVSDIVNVENFAGEGLRADVGGHAVYVGNAKLMLRASVNASEPEKPGTVVHVAVDGEYAGYIIISDSVKPQSAAAVAALKAEGVMKTVMLTGDRKAVAEEVASALGLDEVHSELLPADKVEYVKSMMTALPENKSLAFVGDGINDAPVLKTADVGIAMGAAGSDAAIEAADVVLMDDNPGKVAAAVTLSRRTVHIVHQNIAFALGVKLLFLILAAFGVATMWEAVFADVGVTVIAVLNALRAMK